MDISKKTVDLYKNLWKIREFPEEKGLKDLLANSGERADWFKNKICLDAGCGHGHYTLTMARLGVKKVVALDLDTSAIRQELVSLPRQIKSRITVRKASVLALLFPDNYFDFVFCQGVIHHIKQSEKGFSELVRVLKPGGLLSLGVYGRGSLAYLTADLIRLITTKVPTKLLVKIFSLTLPSEQVIRLTDYLHVPIQKHYSEKQIRNWFARAGFTRITRRHTPWEQYANRPTRLNKVLYGESWIQMTGVKSKKGR
jgi:ubiquinone/menaquinone biosynthesis C-methylase UbiE